MAKYTSSEFKAGLKIILDGAPCAIIDNEFIKPGKGQAFNRVKIRNYKTGRVIERTFKSGESVEAADIVELEIQYLYQDGSFWHFMLEDTFEQYQADADTVGDAAKWLKEQDICTMLLWNDTPLTITPPNFVTLQIADTDKGLKGDTTGAGGKPATLETGAVVRVPLFVQIGEVVKVDTRTAQYVGRANQ